MLANLQEFRIADLQDNGSLGKMYNIHDYIDIDYRERDEHGSASGTLPQGHIWVKNSSKRHCILNSDIYKDR